MNKLRKRISDYYLYAQLFLFAYFIVPLFLRLPIRKLHALLRLSKINKVKNDDCINRITTLMKTLLQRQRPFFSTYCLTKGITLYYFLRRAGLDVKLCFGVGHKEENIFAHCWLEQNGFPYLEKGDPQKLYTEMYRFS